MTGDFSLDQIRNSNDFDFNYLYNNHGNFENDVADSPLAFNNHTCSYFSPEQVSGHFKDISSNTLSLFSLNCRGLSAHWDALKILISEMETPKFAFDIFGLSEIFRFPQDTSFELDGYCPFKLISTRHII